MALKRENPDRTAAQVVRILRASSGWAPSESTLQRLFHRRDLMPARPAGGRHGGVRPVRGRPRRTSGGSATPCTARGSAAARPTCSRSSTTTPALAVGYRFGFAEDTVRLAAALQPALGRPRRPGQLSTSTTARRSSTPGCCGPAPSSGSGWCTPPRTARRAEGRSRGGSAACATSSSSRSPSDRRRADRARHSRPRRLLELNALFTAWVETVYHHRVHSETGQTPLARWNDGWQAPGTARHAVAGRAGRGVPVVRAAHRHQDRDGVAARQHLPSRAAAGRAQGRAGVRPVRPHHHRGPLPRHRRYGPRGAAPDRPPRPPKARPETPDPSSRPHDRDRLPAPGRRRPPRRNSPPSASTSTPSTPPARRRRHRLPMRHPTELSLPIDDADHRATATTRRPVAS